MVGSSAATVKCKIRHPPQFGSDFTHKGRHAAEAPLRGPILSTEILEPSRGTVLGDHSLYFCCFSSSRRACYSAYL